MKHHTDHEDVKNTKNDDSEESLCSTVFQSDEQLKTEVKEPVPPKSPTKETDDLLNQVPVIIMRESVLS